MDDLVDGSFCLAYRRLSLRFSLISFKVSLSVLTLLILSQQSTLGIVVSAASFMESTKCFWYSSMSEVFGDKIVKKLMVQNFRYCVLECVLTN